MTPKPPGASRQAFTLLEIMAVVAIFALVAAIVMPNFSSLQTRILNSAADELVTQIDFARQRAIVTGVPHRLAIDIDAGFYRIEWLGGSDAPERSGENEFEDPNRPFDLLAPRQAQVEFEPLVGTMGRGIWLDDALLFGGVETTGGWIDHGESFIGFEQDGSADPTTVVIEHEAGHTVTLDILPLASNVRVAHDPI